MKEKFLKLKDRVCENFKKNKLITTALLVLWVVVVVFTLLSYNSSLGKISSGNEAYDNVVELVKGSNIIETVDVVEDSSAIGIKLATFARNNNGTINIKVTGINSNKIYADKNINISSIQDNAFVVVELSEKLNSTKDKRIKIEMSSDGVKDNAAGVYYSNLKVFENSELKIGFRTMPGDLTLRFLNDNEDLMLFYRIIIIWVVTTFTIIMLMLLLVKPGYEYLFLFMGIAFGLTFWLIITPMSVPDETIHYEYSFQLSNYIMGKDHLIFNEEYQNYDQMAGHRNVSASYERLIRKINRPMKLRESNVKMIFDIDEAYKTCFIPQALGITVARLFNWNMLRTFYLGRLFNLIFYLGCLYTAIKKTPVHKVLFGIIATLPIFMQQAASFSYDCYINGLTFVIIAYLLKWMYQDEVVDKKEFILAFIANLMIAPIKVVYSLFSLLYWFIPEERFGGKKNKIKAILIITFPAMYQLIVLLFPLAFRIIRKIFENLFAYNTGLNTMSLKTEEFIPSMLEGEVYTFSYVMAHPLEMIELFLRTVRYSLKTWFYASFGRALSGNTLILPTWIVHSILAILVFSSLIEEKKRESIAFKITTFLICVFGGLMITGGLLVSWTEVEQVVIEDYGGPIIQGIQGRYFSPFLPYLFIILHNNKIKLSKKFEPYLIYAFVILVFEVIVYVLSYTFIN